jgi:bifunctional oligoribonuclease and PAP phosphatase NrnA
VNYPSESQTIADLVHSARDILAISHGNPDADAVAALLSFRHVFSSTERSVTMALGAGTVPETLRFLPHLKDLKRLDEVVHDRYDLVIVLDCADETRAGEVGECIIKGSARGTPVINIDHHVTNTRFGSCVLVDPRAAATCEILTLLFQDIGIEFDPDLATMLMAGIQGDTLGLRTPSTTGRTLTSSAVLLDAGADLDTIVDHLFRIRPFSTLKLWGLALSRAEVTGKLVWTEITPDMLQTSGADPSEAEGIVNFLAGTEGGRAAALLYRQSEGWRVSMRSLVDEVDVSDLARLYGGGGHSRAAGCTVLGGTDARDAFISDIADRIGTSTATVSQFG